MVIKVVSCKTDQYREGASLIIARTGLLHQATCPVSMMQRYFDMSHTADKLFS